MQILESRAQTSIEDGRHNATFGGAGTRTRINLIYFTLDFVSDISAVIFICQTHLVSVSLVLQRSAPILSINFCGVAFEPI
jgi:hypothetical protein